MRRTYLSLALTFALGIGAILVFPYYAVTPGVLSQGHQRQRDDCLSCHAPLAGTPAEKCIACHRPSEIGLRSVAGAALAKPRQRSNLVHRVVSGRCVGCHSEHAGLSREKAAARFRHDALPPDLKGACGSCHAQQRPPDVLHATLAANCTPCHTTTAWKPATFDHERYFRFDRDHPARCADCHAPKASLKEYSCTGCHEHSLDRMIAKHRKEGIANVEGCRRCHPSGDERDTLGKKGEGRREGGEHDED